MKIFFLTLAILTGAMTMQAADVAAESRREATFPMVTGTAQTEGFLLATQDKAVPICTDVSDYEVVRIAARMLADDIERVTGRRPLLQNVSQVPKEACVVAGTLGKSRLIDGVVKRLKTDVSSISGKWESYIVLTTVHPQYHTPLLVIIGSDRRGTAFGLTTLSEAIGVSPWYWWADITPQQKEALYVEPGMFCQREP